MDLRLVGLYPDLNLVKKICVCVRILPTTTNSQNEITLTSGVCKKMRGKKQFVSSFCGGVMVKFTVTVSLSIFIFLLSSQPFPYVFLFLVLPAFSAR